jgi:hypothetical protein
MTSSGDTTPDMAFRSTSDVSDRLLSGSAQSVPDGCSPEVARLLSALRSSAPTDGEREQEAVTAFVAALAEAPTRLDDVRRSRRRRSVVVAAATAVSLVLGGTAAAAATNSLPSGAQSAVSRALSHVDVHVPDPAGHGTTHVSSTHGSDRTSAFGPDATGRAQHGLCTAWAAHDAHDTTPGHSGNATAFANLRHAAHDRGMTVAEYCAPVLEPATPATTTPGATGADHGQAGQDQGRSGADHGPSGQEHGTSGPDQSQPGQGQSGDAHGGIGSGTDVGNDAHDTGAGHASGAASDGAANGNVTPNP